MSKKCSVCNKTYEHYGQRNSLCPECRKIYDREYHKKRSEEKKKIKVERQRLRIRENGKHFKLWKESQSCNFCGLSEAVCLDLHHVDPKEKEGCLSDMINGGFSTERINMEISKCMVVCANCHRKIHAGIIIPDHVVVNVAQRQSIRL